MSFIKCNPLSLYFCTSVLTGMRPSNSQDGMRSQADKHTRGTCQNTHVMQFFLLCWGNPVKTTAPKVLLPGPSALECFVMAAKPDKSGCRLSHQLMQLFQGVFKSTSHPSQQSSTTLESAPAFYLQVNVFRKLKEVITQKYVNDKSRKTPEHHQSSFNALTINSLCWLWQLNP